MDDRVGKLQDAIRWSGLTRTDFEDAMLARGLPLYRPTVEDLQHDLDTLALSCWRKRLRRTPS